MAIVLATGAKVCFNTSVIEPSRQCSIVADLVFEGGILKFTRYGVGWSAVSGPLGNGGLPNGRYTCTNLHTRTTPAMVKEGVGFSVDVNPQFNTNRTLLRIHPDGNVAGTQGCIGITEEVRECYEALKRLLPEASSTCELEVK